MFPVAPFIALASVIFSGTIAQDQSNCTRTYTVRLGDTCDDISAAQNVSTYQLATVNSDKINAGCTNLALGEPLCLGLVGEDCTTTYVVQSGDFCAAIADAAGIDLSTLLANNPNVGSDCTLLYPGEVVCTADQVFVTSS
ncbi:hypothetical protein OF83DRAFT_1282231 [Amylostereum chailletii]|nr:hypothetical protein OF83DRAFT_1282231 [Amylostereum chailletii]